MQRCIYIFLIIIVIVFLLIALCVLYFCLGKTTLPVAGNEEEAMTAEVTDDSLTLLDEEGDQESSGDILTRSPHPDIKGHVICYITEYDQPPDDTEGPLSRDELDQIEEVADKEEFEDFRIARTGGGGGRGRGGGGRGGRGGGGRGGRGGRGGFRRRGRGGGMFWPWRRWPRRYWGRPWRSYLWRGYPSYLYNYPLSYYTNDWVAPIQRFTIRIGPKGDRHPFAGEGSDLGYMISTGSATGCGTSGALLSLQRGRTYEFDIYTSKDCVTGENRNEPFFFTTDPAGGSKVGEIFSVQPTRNGTIRITITENLPNRFYYQSTNGEYVGGNVVLHS